MCSDVWYSGQPGRLESTGGASSIQRNRDGVPTWSGEAVLFEEYVEACLLYEQTVAREKRYLCGPRLASELKGSARRVLIGRPADWLSNESGVRRLVAALRQERGQPKVPELSELLQKYFRGTRRARGESMGDFILRKSEAYTRAQQSMARYMKEQGLSGTSRGAMSSRATAPTPSVARSSAPASEAPANTGPDGAESPREEVASQAPEDETDPWQNWNQQWSWNGWSHGGGYYGWWHSDWEPSQSMRDTSEWGRDQLPEILPDFVQGWYLFMDAGLDVMERNVLHAELKGTFGVREVEQVLRKHWSDHDLKRRDAEKGRYMANVNVELTEEDTGCYGEVEPEDLEAEGFSAEEIHAMMMEEEAAQRAMAAMMEAKKTLRDARARQHAVRMSRQFFPPRPQMSGGGSREGAGGMWKQLSRPKTTVQCFRCGGPHKVAECKEKPKTEQSQVATESAPLVFASEHVDVSKNVSPSQQSVQSLSLHTTDPNSDLMERCLLSTSEVVAQGKAVIDGGATRTIGSVTALSQVAELNEKSVE